MEVRDRLVNPVVRLLARSRAHRLLGAHVAVLGYTGRRTGRRYELPVMAAPYGDALVVLVGGAAGKTWWRNLDGAAQDVSVRRNGRTLSCQARLVRAGEPGREAAVAAYRAAFPRVTVAPGDPVVVLDRIVASLPPAGLFGPAPA